MNNAPKPQQAIKARRCQFPGCQTLTMHSHCAKHRPQAQWSISEQARDDFKRRQEHESDET